jgi:hypothetical protein
MGRLYPMATAVVGLWVAVAAISVFARRWPGTPP